MVAKGEDKEYVAQPHEQSDPYPEAITPIPDPPINPPSISFLLGESEKASRPPIPLYPPPPREPKKE